ncbi:HNH endonuclease [Rhodococcoides yunnanense]|uniref:HNH endonuclease n=1 Tax=Rhodococcoides yunnanense TaxID=278209 RepID=UPI000933F5AF|nr:HNH endonuclease signature motif containing protein [Rhodococcus yunnanensis]
MDAVDVLRFVRRLNKAALTRDAAAGIELIAALESVKSACAAAQAVTTDAVATAISDERKALGKPKAQWRNGIPSQIGLARRESPNRGSRYLELSRALVHELPHTLERLRAGDLNERRAALIAKETACLNAEDRREADRQLCADASTLKGLGDKSIEGKSRVVASTLDPAFVVRRYEKSYSERRSSTRPRSDHMCDFDVLTSMDRAVAMWSTLERDAASIIAAGGEARTRDQLMSDLAYERITGAASAAAGAGMVVNVVIPDTTLFGEGTESGHLQGYGDIPSDIARHLVAHALSKDTYLALRRVYANPSTGALTAMESTARAFPTALARLIEIRDRRCRTPWCDAPIRHSDHIESFADGGETTANNGAGLCAACNYAKEAGGWWIRPRPPGRPGQIHIYDIITSTGHEYTSEAPRMPVVRHYISAVENVVIDKAVFGIETDS